MGFTPAVPGTTFSSRTREGRAIRILVIEDEPHVAQVIDEALAAQGHEIVRAADAGEAERCLASGIVDGITLDLRIPGQDGLDWLSTLFAARPELARRTLVVTGTALSPAECLRVASCGASFLAKPFRIEDLVELLAKKLSPIHRAPFSRN